MAGIKRILNLWWRKFSTSYIWNCNIMKLVLGVTWFDLWTKWIFVQIFSWGSLLKVWITSAFKNKIQSLEFDFKIFSRWNNVLLASVCYLGSRSNSPSCIHRHQSICRWLLRPLPGTCQTQSKWNATGFSIWCDLCSISAGKNSGFLKKASVLRVPKTTSIFGDFLELVGLSL